MTTMMLIGILLIALPFVIVIAVGLLWDWRAMLVSVGATTAAVASITMGVYLVTSKPSDRIDLVIPANDPKR